MPRPKKGPRLGGSPQNQKLILRNLAADLFFYGKVETTVAKAKLVRPYAEKLMTKARTPTLHNRRQVIAEIGDLEVVTKLFDDVAPRYVDRNGGYTRIVKMGPRRGDGAEMAVIELV